MQKDNKRKLDKILIKDLLLRCIIGVNEFERKEKQDVVINVEIWVDITKAVEADDFQETVDYKEINKAIIKLVEKSKFFLIETLAEKVAQICLRRKKVERVTVTIEKPGALRFARSVGIEIIREKGKELAHNMTVAFLSLGSNIKPQKNILEAIRLLSEHIKILQSSTVFLTEPLIRRSQPKYYNCVMKVETSIQPRDLKFNVLRLIETQLGRKRTEDKYANRTIDIDIILYGSLQLSTRELTIPDPEIWKRAFLAVSLCEIEPNLLLPPRNTPIREVARRFKNHKMITLEDFTATVQNLVKSLSVQDL